MRKPYKLYAGLLAALLTGPGALAQYTTSTKTITSSTPNGSGGLSTPETNQTTVLGPVAGTEPLDAYLGALNRPNPNPKPTPTGYFDTCQDGNGVWHLVTPDGHLFYSLGVNSVNTGTNPQDMLKNDLKANTLGKWSSSFATKTMPYTVSLDFSFNYKNTQGERGDNLFEKGILPVFDSGFVSYCNSRAQSAITPAMLTDKFLLGYWTDNEVPLGNPYGKSLINIWTDLATYQGYAGALGANDPNYLAAVQWVKNRHNGSFTITAADKPEFPYYVATTYYKACRDAVKARGDKHLLIGSRLHQDLENPRLLRAAQDYMDVVSVNCYKRWSPQATALNAWSGRSSVLEKPFIISEFYAMEDSIGFANRTGAGWVVQSQQERADFFENFTLAMLAEKNCVGFHWFRWQDDAGLKNNGLVKADFSYWTTLKDSYAKVAKDVYNLRTWRIFGALKGSVLKDAYVRGGTYSGTNYGSESVMDLKENADPSLRRRGLLMVQSSETDAFKITSAKVKLYCNSLTGSGPLGTTVSMYEATPATWYEGSVTYGTAPTPGVGKATTTVTAAGTYYTWDVTTYIKQRVADGYSISSFMLQSSATDDLVEFNTREAATNKPVFELNGKSYGGVYRTASVQTAAGAAAVAAVDAYPNPAATTLHLALPGPAESVTVTVYDATGRRVAAGPHPVRHGAVELDLAGLPAGLYRVEVRDGATKLGRTQFVKE